MQLIGANTLLTTICEASKLYTYKRLVYLVVVVVAFYFLLCSCLLICIMCISFLLLL